MFVMVSYHFRGIFSEIVCEVETVDNNNMLRQHETLKQITVLVFHVGFTLLLQFCLFKVNLPLLIETEAEGAKLYIITQVRIMWVKIRSN